MKYLLAITLSCLFCNCQSLNKRQSDTVMRVATEQFGNEVIVVYNSTQTYALMMDAKKPDQKLPVNALRYAIYNLKKKSIVFRENKYNATVSWVGDRYVKVSSQPGVQSLDEGVNKRMSVYYIDVTSAKKLEEVPR